MTPDEPVSSPELVCQAQITYRQLDHWTRAGYLKPITPGGSGNPRDWPPEECRVATAMGALVKAGLMPAAAHDIARTGFPAAVLSILAERRR